MTLDTAPSAGTHQKTILVVEDNHSERLRLAAIITRLGYSVVEAEDGMEALRIVESQLIDLVISDWRMPNMTGFELCQNIKSDWQCPPYFILLTGQNSILDLAAAMDAGADDFIAKPFAAEELRARISAGLRIIDSRQQLSSLNTELLSSLANETNRLDQLRTDLAAAESLQRSVLPGAQQLPAGLNLLQYFRGATGVNGDAYNVIPLQGSVVCFYLIDISGHGVRSAMLSFYATQLLSSRMLIRHKSGVDSWHPESPSQLVSRLNTMFLKQFEGRDYLTMIYGTLDVQTGKGLLCQAGHPAPVIYSTWPGREKKRALNGGGFPVGILEEAVFRDQPFELGTDERLIISSDGLLDCVQKTGAPLSLADISELLDKIRASGPDRLQARLENALDQLIQPQEPVDDISILIMERSAHRQPPRRDQEIGT
ncbi:PP2C family protein-serine/threonine phosphatase [Marinobacter daepoensis]|uniref:PP2C family protein-serine/threonine phosphatase n=1 Tax=Marinobacter daepoensis TaxID=262077 RepID=UPI0004114375|nr:SpoIIE family protein phosphatase [Marinobacter daepoensis]